MRNVKINMPAKTMSRQRGSKKRHRRSCRRKKAHESDPELQSPRKPGRETRDTSPAWNSLDEESLVDFTLHAPASSRKSVGGSESAGEMEVTKRLSCLNFSVIPCAMDPALFGGPNIAGGCEHGSETEVFSELTSASHLEALLPGEGKETPSQRPNRKRSSRRRPNKRTKKMKNSYYATWTNGQLLQRSGHGQVMADANDGAREERRKMPERRSTLSRARFNPMARVTSNKQGEESLLESGGSNSQCPNSHHVPMGYPLVRIRRMEIDDCSSSCILSDGSAVCDMENGIDPGEEMVNGPAAMAMSCSFGQEGGEAECTSDDESELSSESTIDR